MKKRIVRFVEIFRQPGSAYNDPEIFIPRNEAVVQDYDRETVIERGK
jgi:hypothetical protein